ncbi:MAG: DUF2207 domain-containing protein [Eubacteriaceae bacterium]|nr:DUF2207 domain-containing protein [Eubacteriaceae bacterium]
MKRIVVILAMALVMTLSIPAAAFAGSGFTTSRYDVDVDITASHVCKITENIKVNFTEARHGIFRYIPYEQGIYTIKKINVTRDPYEVSTEYNNGWHKIIKIGDPDEEVSGEHFYVIGYNIVGYEDGDTENDYLSLDLLPTGWDTSIKKSHIKVKLPKAIDENQLKLYVGQYGASNNEADIDFKYNKKTNIIEIKAKNLEKGCGITISAQLPEGYWENPANRKWMSVPLIAVLGAVPLLLILLWFLFGRDPKVIKPVEFYPPEQMTSAEIGYVIDGSVDYKDLISLIMYFAGKGYITITEYKKNQFSLTKIKEIDRSEKHFAKTFFRGLFDEGDTVKTDELPASFGDDFMLAQQQLRDYYRGKKSLFTLSSKICRTVGIGLMFMPPIIAVAIAAAATFRPMYLLSLIPIGLCTVISMLYIVLLFDKWDATGRAQRKVRVVFGGLFACLGVGISAFITASLMENILYAVLVVASALVSLVAVVFMKKRSAQSAALYGRVLGFRDFIENAELEKLNMLVEDDPEYFYNILPYAYVMGLSDKWAKKFEKIKINQPEWYYGYGSDPLYSALWYSHMFRNCAETVQTNVIKNMVEAASDTGGGSIGGGFGGGGFSGGGFGGGGGGSW